MVTTVLAFLLALGVLVTFHEFGHYWVARRMGVKVLRFHRLWPGHRQMAAGRN